jgi:organic hydroperoxide reductase OsmC/OhrA
MPKVASAGWSVAWSASNEHSTEIASEDELAAAEHLGCFGAALSHAMAAAEIAPTQLRLAAEAHAAPEGALQPITIEVHAHIPGAPLAPTVVESVARRTHVSCPVWTALASEGRLQFVAVLEDAATPSQSAGTSKASDAHLPTVAPAREKRPLRLPRVNIGGSLQRLVPTRMPKLLTPRMAMLLVVALAGFARFAHPWA